MTKFINKDEVKNKARGKWLEVISNIVPFFAEAASKVGIHHTCPIHGGLDGFRFYKDADETGGGVCNSCGNFPDGLSLLTWATDKSFIEVLKDVAEVVGSGQFSNPVSRVAPVKKDDKAIEQEDQVKRLRLRAAVSTSIKATAPGSRLVHSYLNSRGLTHVPESLRFHPSMAYQHDDRKRTDPNRIENLPAMLAIVHAPDGTPVTIHRTYLDPKTGKKANVPSPKKMMSFTSDKSLQGVAIRLFPATGDTLGIAEGIETAIAVYEGTGIPTWSCISSSLMKGFVPPEHVKRVIVFADKDRKEVGLSSAKKLVEELWSKGIQASIELPPSDIPVDAKGIDWHDEFVSKGPAVFPKIANS